jgi:hypothetical protein
MPTFISEQRIIRPVMIMFIGRWASLRMYWPQSSESGGSGGGASNNIGRSGRATNGAFGEVCASQKAEIASIGRVRLALRKKRKKVG